MRKRHWLASLLSGWLSVVGGQAFAQSPPIGPGYAGNPDQSGMLPAPYSANYGMNPSSYSGMQGGYPPDATAWPNVSPYMGPAVDQTANENGVWFRNIISGNRKYFFTSEALMGFTNIPNGVVGAPGVNTINLPATILPLGSLQNNNSQFQQTAAGTSTLGTPDRQLSNSGGTSGTSGNSSNGTGTTTGGNPPVFATQSVGEIPNALNSGGARLTWGWWNPDDTGFQVAGFFLTQVHSTLDIADGNGFNTQDYLNAVNSTNSPLQTYLLNELHAIAGIPLGGADTDHNGLSGVQQPFDMFYILQYTTQVGGGNVDYYGQPWFDRSAIKLRPLYGGRYVSVRESFLFQGGDSGLGYTINSPSSETGGTSGGTTGTSGTGTNTGSGLGYLSPVTLEPTASTLNPMYSALASSVNTQLAGPEIGLRLDLGKEKFNIFTQSKFALLVNYSSSKLSGYNIGDAYYPATNGTVTNPTVMPRNDPAATAFNSSTSTTTLSPMFEESVFIKGNIFQYVPVLNRTKVFSQAELQLGYTAMFIGNMARPATDINWQAYPVNPSLTSYRQTFFTSNYSLGFQWTY